MTSRATAPTKGDAADLRQCEEYERACLRGRPKDVGEPGAVLKYRLGLWRDRMTAEALAQALAQLGDTA